MFQISVIIPVYNAADFVKVAVDSALSQPQVEEVILIEDGSMDDSFNECKRVAASNPKVRLFCHDNHHNRGVSASRNLGISKASFEFIAFLDADDWYNEGRFKKDEQMFQDANVMASYSMSSISLNTREVMFGYRSDILQETQVREQSKFYHYVISNNIILGHTNCNTFRKVVFHKAGFFDERLNLHQDTEMWNRIARHYLWDAGELSRSISVARRHSGNRIANRSKRSEIIHQLVWMDNIGIKNLHGFEKKAVIYHLARALSNPIKNHFLRKSVLHGFQCLANATRPVFILVFYRWGMRKYNLYKT
ncbi:glycosyltransferase family 2 protein [Algoriphagus sp. AGSA1]|uniref:glycosyltransferase family 2 protein n=1 Tax=Algoriphagus sp. AGSA1 TaxID=2907213 RepID=UPI001F315F9C|nr:glycosyltransferase family 2 protein [Algoriphagus sp. AGSA1]MCE7054128.1 glycosyltransferase family 2 protein [Algoriphagus sp. AGSA1]